MRVRNDDTGHPFVQTGLRHLVERAPHFDGHIGGQAALYAPGPHVAPSSLAVDRHRKPPRLETFATNMDQTAASDKTRYL